MPLEQRSPDDERRGARGEARGGGRAVRRGRRLLGRRRAGKRGRARRDDRPRRPRLQVLPRAVGRRGVPGGRRGGSPGGAAGARRVGRRPPRSRRGWRAPRGVRGGNARLRRVPRFPAAGGRERVRDRAPRPARRRVPDADPRRSSLGRGRAAAARAGACRRVAADRGDLPALSLLRRRSHPARRDRVQMRAADPRPGKSRAALEGPRRRPDRNWSSPIIRPAPPEGKTPRVRRFRAGVGRHLVARARPAGGLDARRGARGVHVASLAEWMGAAPARLAGLAGRKGALAPGARRGPRRLATRKQSFEVRPDALHHRHKLTPYAGRTLFGRVEATFLSR